MLSLITAFALAIVVLIVGVLASSIYVIRTTLREQKATLDRWASETSLRFEKLDSETKQRSPAALAARLEDLAAAVDSHAARTRKELGKVWGTLGAEKPRSADPAGGDDELAAFLELQTAGPPPRTHQ